MVEGGVEGLPAVDDLLAVDPHPHAVVGVGGEVQGLSAHGERAGPADGEVVGDGKAVGRFIDPVEVDPLVVGDDLRLAGKALVGVELAPQACLPVGGKGIVLAAGFRLRTVADPELDRYDLLRIFCCFYLTR